MKWPGARQDQCGCPSTREEDITQQFTAGSGLFAAVKINAKLIDHCLNF